MKNTCRPLDLERAVELVYNGKDPEIIALFMLGEVHQTAQELREAASKRAIALGVKDIPFPLL